MGSIISRYLLSIMSLSQDQKKKNLNLREIPI